MKELEITYKTHKERAKYPILIPVSVNMNPGDTLTVTLTPRKITPDSHIYVYEVDISKFPDYGYEIYIDGRKVYPGHGSPTELAGFPPSDIDAPSETWNPPMEIVNNMVIKIHDLRDSGSTNTLHIRIKGYEEVI